MNTLPWLCVFNWFRIEFMTLDLSIEYLLTWSWNADDKENLKTANLQSVIKRKPIKKKKRTNSNVTREVREFRYSYVKDSI